MASLSRLTVLGLLTAASLALPGAGQEPRVGAPAPAFKATDSHGQTEALDQFHGKYVVLEWHNQGCPYTRKHYVSGNMQALQKEWTEKGVAWFTVISSAPGQQGYVTPAQENAYVAKMHVIDPSGKLIYAGAIDDRPTPDPDDVHGAHNYVSDALTEAMAGKSVATPYTRPYGCSVKYPD